MSTHPVHIGENLLHQPALLRQYVRAKQVLIVSNPLVAEHYLAPVQEAFTGTEDYQCDVLLLPDGDQHKNIEQWYAILTKLADNQHHRDTTLIALGGGVIGDMTGFAAASYHRGVRFIQCPTTLLAQADAAIGGKTGINHPCGKNLIGAFHQPAAVISDVTALTTLDLRQFRAGLAEVIKAALIYDADFFSWLEAHMDDLLAMQTDALIYAVQKAADIKRNVVAEDEKEHGLRAILNFGHTFGHAIEQNLDYSSLLHGEAVAIGMQLAAELSVSVLGLSSGDALRIRNLLLKTGLPVDITDIADNRVGADQLFTAMHSDKKIINSTLRLILLDRLGHAVIRPMADSECVKNLLRSRVKS